MLIDENPELKGLAGLEKLVSTPGLFIRDNPKLTGLAALQAGALVDVIEDYDVAGIRCCRDARRRCCMTS